MKNIKESQKSPESRKIAEELTEIKRNHSRYCSYINSYTIEKELEKIKENSSPKYDIEEKARSIASLTKLHLKRLNRKLNSGVHVPDFTEMDRQAKNPCLLSMEEYESEFKLLYKSIGPITKKSEQEIKQINMKNFFKNGNNRKFFFRNKKKNRGKIPMKNIIIILKVFFMS